MFGVFVFGGLIAVPIIWGYFNDLPYERQVALSLVGCFVFAYAHTRNGAFSFGRFIVAFGFVLLLTLRAAAQHPGGVEAVIPAGILGFLVMGGCGWIGVGISRAVGISKALAMSDPPGLTVQNNSGSPPQPRVETKTHLLDLKQLPPEVAVQRWDCPKCGESTENTSYRCTKCGYSVV
jgi:hypothetical protein